MRASNELRKPGILVSSGGIRSIWLRNGLETFKKRLSALEERAAKEGIVYTEAQLCALESSKRSRESDPDEIETQHPGYLVSQDTFYVGYLKGVGRIYQQTAIDTFSSLAFAKLYTAKVPVTAADLLNDQVLPFFKKEDVPVLRVLTDRGTEYCGAADRHPFYQGMKGEGEKEIITLCRSGFLGSQKYGAAIWSGDIDSTFESLRVQVRAGLNMPMSGIPWWTTDIGGFKGGNINSNDFKELIIRWFQFGVFCPIFRLHGYRLDNNGDYLKEYNPQGMVELIMRCGVLEKKYIMYYKNI